MFYRDKLKVFLFVLYSLSLLACDQRKSLISYLKPSKEVILELQDINPFHEISFLFIIDTSSSMPDRRKVLASNINFLEAIFREYPYYGYNFAFTTMSPDSHFSSRPPLSLQRVHCGMNFSKMVVDTDIGPYLHSSFKKNVEAQAKAFVCLVSSNIENIKGTSNEPFFDSLSYIMRQSDLDFKSRFFSPNNFLVLIWISDAYGNDDQQYSHFLRKGKYKEGAEIVSEDLLDKLRILKGGTQNIRSYAVVADDRLNDDCGTEGAGKTESKYPFHLYRFIEKTGGLRVSLCDPTWGTKLTEVYKDLLHNFMFKRVYLEDVPKRSTIKVFLNDKEVPESKTDGWFFYPEELSIHLGQNFNSFLYPSAEKDTLRITYQPVNIELLRE